MRLLAAVLILRFLAGAAASFAALATPRIHLLNSGDTTFLRSQARAEEPAQKIVAVGALKPCCHGIGGLLIAVTAILWICGLVFRTPHFPLRQARSSPVQPSSPLPQEPSWRLSLLSWPVPSLPPFWQVPTSQPSLP